MPSLLRAARAAAALAALAGPVAAAAALAALAGPLAVGAAPAAATTPADAVPAPAPGALVDGIPCRADPGQTYAAYLPAAYDATRAWPLLVVFDPRARGALAAEIFTPAAAEHGWIVLSSNGTMSDGPWDVNVRAVNALWPEIGRFAVDPRRIHAAGFSGGAMVAWSVAQTTGQVAGIIAAGAPLPSWMASGEVAFAHFGAAGLWDFNHLDMRDLDRLVARHGAPHRLEVFAGRHEWLPPELAAEAVAWLELLAMGRGARPVDAALVERSWAAEMAAAQALEAAGDGLAARRRYEVVVETFAALREVGPARLRLEALAADPAVRREEREEERSADWERATAAAAFGKLAALEDPAVHWPPERLAAELGVKDLQRRAAGEGVAADAAERVLAALFVQLSFYLPREDLPAGRYQRAATVLAVAATIRPLPHVLYNLGAAEARRGRAAKALEALERAVAAGYGDAAHLAADEDYAALRESPAFQAILARLRQAPPPPAP